MSSSPSTDGPRHEQVAVWLRAQIADGALAPGARLPTEHTLCAQFGVSRITVRHALATLDAEGLVVRRQGSGSFVALPRVPTGLARLTSFAEDAGRAGLSGTSRVLYHGPDAADAFVAGALGLDVGAPIVRLDRLRLADAVPVAFDRAWLPPDLARHLDGHDLAAATLFGLFEARGLVLGRGHLRIDATAATNDVASVLDVAPGMALLRLVRTIATDDGRTLYVQCRQYRADRAAFDLTLARDAHAPVALPSGALPVRDLDTVLLPPGSG